MFPQTNRTEEPVKLQSTKTSISKEEGNGRQAYMYDMLSMIVVSIHVSSILWMYSKAYFQPFEPRFPFYALPWNSGFVLVS